MVEISSEGIIVSWAAFAWLGVMVFGALYHGAIINWFRRQYLRLPHIMWW